MTSTKTGREHAQKETTAVEEKEKGVAAAQAVAFHPPLVPSMRAGAVQIRGAVYT